LTLICERDPGGAPATHALVVGVGEYPWLIGGTEQANAALAEGMGQLSSPPASARAITDWLLGSHADPTAPLATIDLLLSAADGEQSYRPEGGDTVAVDMAEKEALVAAIRAWRTRCDSHPGNVALFFFCGHGVGRGFDLALLARDFGAEPEQPFDHSIWF